MGFVDKKNTEWAKNNEQTMGICRDENSTWGNDASEGEKGSGVQHPKRNGIKLER